VGIGSRKGILTEGTDGDIIPGNVLEVEISSIAILRNYVVPSPPLAQFEIHRSTMGPYPTPSCGACPGPEASCSDLPPHTCATGRKVTL
jgi:hypothetical protein